ncbi:hypothetical protein Y032_0083g1670 [Ancylostoma ceylanicum]|uniref:Uncharacterized protein n=1 Tax=Ancylostoma ceylanicum TaxID=53326 RepID=A0A016TQF8_9BILA|nr:hypothetical protein Y032_0083g1670 [Ancylostoma ceylanicum]
MSHHGPCVCYQTVITVSDNRFCITECCLPGLPRRTTYAPRQASQTLRSSGVAGIDLFVFVATQFYSCLLPRKSKHFENEEKRWII